MNRRIRNRLVAHGHALVSSEVELRATENATADDKLRITGVARATAGGKLCVAGDSAAGGKSFFEWFRQDVLGLDSDEYRRAFWREAYRTGHTLGPIPRTFKSWQRERGVPPSARLGDMLMICLVVGGASLAFWFVRREVRRHLNRVRRPSYYDTERARRLALAQERRRQGRRSTTNPCPSLDAVRALFAEVRHDPEAALRLGGLLEDLECYLDNRPRFAGNRCLGRAGGIKRHLQEHAPDLFAHYSALMRYKAIAKRFRQAAGVDDPVPADALLPGKLDIPAEDAGEGRAASVVKNRAEGRGVIVVPAARKRGAQDEETAVVPAAARERAAEILAEGAGTVVALEAALALRLDPDCIPAMADRTAVRTRRTPPRIFDWLRRRRSA